MNYEQKANKYKIKYLKLKKELEQKYGKSIEQIQMLYGGKDDINNNQSYNKKYPPDDVKNCVQTPKNNKEKKEEDT